jgi:hypothetical protein
MQVLSWLRRSEIGERTCENTRMRCDLNCPTQNVLFSCICVSSVCHTLCVKGRTGVAVPKLVPIEGHSNKELLQAQVSSVSCLLQNMISDLPTKREWWRLVACGNSATTCRIV